MKLFTVAMALDSGATTLGRLQRQPAAADARFTISDYHPKKRWLSTPEVLVHSSNIGSALMALDVGTRSSGSTCSASACSSRGDRAAGSRRAAGAEPVARDQHHDRRFRPRPGDYAAAAGERSSALVNGGVLRPASLKLRDEQEPAPGMPVLSSKTSRQMRELMRQVVLHGTGAKADVPGYKVGGKTGTAEKLVRGHYIENARISSFVGAFPIDAPRYVVLAMLDEPKGNRATANYATGGWVAAPVVARLVRHMAPLLGIAPVPDGELPDGVRKASAPPSTSLGGTPARRGRSRRCSRPSLRVEKNILRLTDLLSGNSTELHGAQNGAIRITGLTADSRQVQPGFLFAALAGSRADGQVYIDEAVRRGAAAILAPAGATRPSAIENGAPQVALVLDDNPRRLFALMAARFYARQPKTVAAVTGTNGKTSVVWFLRQIWDALGHSAGSSAPSGSSRRARPVGQLDHARSGDPAPNAGSAGRAGSGPAGHRSLQPRARSVPARRRRARRRRLHQPEPRSPRLSRQHGGLSVGQAAAVLRAGRRRGAAVVCADDLHAHAVRSVAAERGLRVLTYGRQGEDLRILHSSS